MLDKYLSAKSVIHLLSKTIVFLIAINVIFTCLFYATDILWDKPQSDLLLMFGEIILIIYGIVLGRKIKRINGKLIDSNLNKINTFLIATAIFLGVSYYIFFSTSGMMQSVILIDDFRTYLDHSGITENALHRFIICIIAQFGVWAPINISICFLAMFMLNLKVTDSQNIKNIP